MILNPKLAWLPILCCVALLIGCSGPAGRETVEISGTVTLDGEPVADAAVMFTGPEGGSPIAATTDASGNFTMNAVPGANQVAVSKIETTGEVAATEEDAGDAMPDDGAMAAVTETFLTPVKYANIRTSGLSVDVSAGMEPVKLDLVNE